MSDLFIQQGVFDMRSWVQAMGTMTLGLAAGSVVAADPLDGVFAEWGTLSSGKTIIPFNLTGSNFSDAAVDSVVGPDGSMYLAGTVMGADGKNRIGVAKLTPEGILNAPGFHQDGKNVSQETDVSATGIALSGNFLLVSGIKIVGPGDQDFIVCRFSAISGASVNFPAVNSSCVKPVFLPGGADRANDIAVQPDGMFILAGTLNVGLSSFAGFARFHADGQPDLEFGNIMGSNMAVIRNEAVFSSHAISALAIAGNRKIVGVGTTNRVGSTQGLGLMIRLNPDGSQDDTTSNGEFSVALAQNPKGTSFNDLVLIDESPGTLNNDEAIVTIGSRSGISSTEGVIAKIKATGNSLDNFNFGTASGYTSLSISGSLQFKKIARADQGTGGGGFVVAGTRPGVGNDPFDIAVYRFKRSGAIDTVFGTGGNVVIDMGTPLGHDTSAGISVHRDGVYFSGTSRQTGQDHDMIAGKLSLDRIYADDLEKF